MASKKHHQAFNNRVIRAILDLGAVKGNSQLYQYSINTKYGELGISVHEPYPSPVFSIFTRFSGEENPLGGYTGKWNFHSWSQDECIDNFTNQLKSILCTQQKNSLEPTR